MFAAFVLPCLLIPLSCLVKPVESLTSVPEKPLLKLDKELLQPP